MIADTDFLIDLMKRDAGARQKLRELEAGGIPVKIPAMAVLELYIGVGAEMTDDEEQKVRQVLQPHPFVPMTDEISRLAGRRIGEGNTAKLKKNKGDAAIGATGEIEGEPVLTRNVDDFEAFGVDVETY
ncbi:PIN domain-containing protein [Haloplanus pelagicus]|jgi:predicted nucleic acid-binding protein|uniref:PIN domain-containing protein n=1 Tax=Haloplanus pelagicus TaxID=2949995 RepID=UPI002041C664|nr:PIN domain-containing protein [Haloplanus sp. HW8-1]